MCCFATSFSVSGLQSSSSEICLSRLVSETEASPEVSPAPAVAMCADTVRRCPGPVANAVEVGGAPTDAVAQSGGCKKKRDV